MAEVAFGSLQWQKAASNSPDLVAPYACDFTAASSYRFAPRGTLATTPGTVSGAQGVIIDNMLNGVALQMQCGPIIEICPAFQKTFIQLDPGASLDVVIAGSSGMARVYFFTGAFHGNTQNVNTYAAYKAGVVSTNTDGTQDVYFNSIRWKVDALLANGFNLDSLTDSGFFDVLNPVSPASGNLGAGTWLIESHVYSASNLYSYQQARNILSPDTQVFERRQLGGSGWTPWRNIGLTVTGQCQFQYVSATQCKLAPMGGGLLTINGNVEAIPPNLVIANAIGAQSLAGLTVYFAYAFMTGQTMTLEWSTTAFALDARGCPIKSGDATRTCVGMCYTDASGKFQDTATVRGIATYFNRVWRAASIYQSQVQSGSTSYIGGSVCSMLSWGTDAIVATTQCYASNSSASAPTCLATTINGASGINTATSAKGGGLVDALASCHNATVGVGLSNINASFFVGSGTGTWSNVTTEVHTLQ